MTKEYSIQDFEERILGFLTPREAQAITTLFNEKGEKIRTLKQAAEEMNLSEGRVAQIRDRALMDLRNPSLRFCPIVCQFLGVEVMRAPPEVQVELISLEKRMELAKQCDHIQELKIKSSIIVVQLQKDLVTIGIALQDAVRTHISMEHSKQFFENLVARFNILWHKIEKIEENIQHVSSKASRIEWKE